MEPDQRRKRNGRRREDGAGSSFDLDQAYAI